MTSSHWRIAAGSCLFATVLMANSGVAVAFADTDAGNATTTANAADTSASGAADTEKQTSPLVNGALALRNSLHGVAAALGLDHQFNGQTGDSTNSSKGFVLDDPFAATAHITRTVTGALDRRPAAVAPTTDPVTPQPVAAPYVAPATDPGPAFNLATPAATVIAAAQGAVAPVVTQLAAIPSLAAAPIADVLTSLQNAITATNDAVAPLVQLPADFANLFPATATQPVAASGSHTAAVSVPTPLLTVRALADMGTTASSTDGGQPVVTPQPAKASMLDTTAAVAGGSSKATTAPADPQAAVSEGLQQFFQAYGTLIIAASLSALLGAALPGILGIVIPTIAGMRIGYRQAKAGSTLRTTDIARFAVSGPVGIVRSGSLVAFRPRVSRPTPQPVDVRAHQVA